MVSHCHSAMPGSFAFDHVLTPKLDTDVGARSNIFQPPRTPSASTVLHQSTTSLSSEDGFQTSRKRLRQENLVSNEAVPHFDDHRWANAQSTAGTPGAMSPAPFVNTRYRLAGGLDTPTAGYASGRESAISPDLTLRGGRGWRPGSGSSPESYFPQLAREGNGRSRHARVTSRQDGWGRTIYSVIGVAGKVWEFCRTNAFRGFYAGGGQGYSMRPPINTVDGQRSIWESYGEKEKMDSVDDGHALVPGGFPDEDYIPDYMSHDHMTPSRPAKRLQREKGEADLGASWIMVERNHARTSRESSPCRITARKVPLKSSSPGRRPPSRPGQRPILPASRPCLTSFAGSPALQPGGPASYAHPRSPISSPKHESPVSADVQKHMARIRKREIEEDANLKRFNQQLKAMIREGKEALGTKFEIDEVPDDVVGEGYVEGDLGDAKMS